LLNRRRENNLALNYHGRIYESRNDGGMEY